jgi:hypothetical protein
MAKESEEDKTWRYLKQQHLTLDEKIELVASLNLERSQQQWEEAMERVKKLIKEHKK